jgi:chorismate mutase-like protein
MRRNSQNRKKKIRVEVTKLLLVGIFSIAVLHSTAHAAAKITCSPTHSEANILRAGNRHTASPHPPGASVLKKLIEQRLNLMSEVAKAKWNTGSAIEDPTREQQLLADVAVKASTAGISAEWAQHFFRFQIEAAKQVQYRLFAQWTAERRGPFPQVEDLRTDIRPKLDLLTAELLKELARQWPVLTQRGLPEQKDSSSQPSANYTARRLAWLPFTDGSLQSLRHVQ